MMSSRRTSAVHFCLFFADVGLKCGGLFRLSAGNPKLVERLRVSFDRTGDADLEGAGDVAAVAALLKLWLRELPEPVVASHVATELLDIHESKFLTVTNMCAVACRTIHHFYLVDVKLQRPEWLIALTFLWKKWSLFFMGVVHHHGLHTLLFPCYF
jgi:hypothetical protein